MLDYNTTRSPPHMYWGIHRAQDWRLTLCWLPKKCFLTQKPLWGKRAYHGVRWITGPGDPVPEHYWIEKDEFIMWRLKNV
jgi:hypothetical protein